MQSDVAGRKSFIGTLVAVALACAGILLPAAKVQAQACPSPNIQVTHNASSFCELCDGGQISLTIRNNTNNGPGNNTGQGITNLVLQDDLQQVANVLRYTNGSAQISITGAANPGQVDPVITGSSLQWDFGSGYAIDRNESMTVTFDLEAIPGQQEELVNLSRALAASLSFDYLNCGGTPSSGNANSPAFTLPIREPRPSITKAGINVDAGMGGGDYTGTLYGHEGDGVVWRVTLSNAGPVTMQDVKLSDDMTPGAMDIVSACSAQADAIAVANGASASTGSCTDVSARNNSITDLTSSDLKFSLDVANNLNIYFAGALNNSCENQINTVHSLEWGCPVVAPEGGINQSAVGGSPSPDSVTTTLSVLSQDSGGANGGLNFRADYTGINGSGSVGMRGQVTLTVENLSGGTVKNIRFTDTLPDEYIVDPNFNPTMTINSLFASYGGRVSDFIWENAVSPVAGNQSYLADPGLKAPVFSLHSNGSQANGQADQINLMRHGDIATITFQIVQANQNGALDYYDRTADMDAAGNADPDPAPMGALQSDLQIEWEDFCAAGSVKNKNVNFNFTPDPEDLDISMDAPLYIVKDSGTTDLSITLRNDGGHRASNYYAYVTIGEAMNVVGVPNGCIATANPPQHPDGGAMPLWNNPGSIPASADVYLCSDSNNSGLGTIPGGASRTRTFQVEKNHNATEDDLTFRADVVGEITLANGEPLAYPAPANLADTTPNQQRANNYSLDVIRAKVLGFNLQKSLVPGSCTELAAGNRGGNEENILIGEDCRFEIYAGGWFGFNTPGFNLIQVEGVSISDDLPDGQGYIDHNFLNCIDASFNNPDTQCDMDLAATASAGWGEQLGEMDLQWTLNDVVNERNRWFLADMTTRLLNDPVDTVAAPNQHGAISSDYARVAFIAKFDDADIPVDNLNGRPNIPGYPLEDEWREDLTVTEPQFEIVKQVCNEVTSGGCSSDADFSDTAEGTRFDTFIYKITVSNRNADAGIPRAPGYDLVVIDNLDARGQMCVQDFASDGLDNDGDGTTETDGAQEGFLGTAPFQNDYDMAAHCDDGGTPAVISFRHDLSSAMKRLDAGGSVSFTYRVAPHQSVAPRQPFLNTTFARYDSLANEFGNQNAPQLESDADLDGIGDDLGLPNNSGRARHYETASTTANMQIIPVQTQPKQALTTSTMNAALTTPSSGDASAATIGEEIQYRLTAQIPPSRLRDLTVTDQLPEGLRCTDAPEVDLDAIASAAGAIFVPGGQFNLANGGITCSDDTVTWNFGLQDLTTAGGRRLDVPVDFIARVENTALTNDGNTITNGGAGTTAEVSYVDETGALQRIAFDSHSIAILEPVIALQKDFSVINADAADIVTVTVTAENIGSAAAYNLQVLDDLVASYYTYIGNIGGNDPPDSDADGTNTNAPIFSWNRANSHYALAPGETRSFTFQVQVNDDVAPHQVLTNTLQSRWQSLPGNDIALNRNGVIGNDGDIDGMRFGELPIAGDAMNDYETTADAQTEVLPLTIVKTDLDNTVIPTIGAHKHFQLEIQLPEGISSEVSISDLLDANGTGYALTRNSDYDVSYEFIGIESINGQAPSEAAFNSFPADGSTAPGTASWDIGVVDTEQEDDVAANNLTPTIRIQYYARINNDTGTDAGDTLNNTATLNYRNGETGVTETLNASAPATSVVEPLLQLEKTLVNLTSTGQPAAGGDILEYTLRITHAGGSSAAAFDLNLVDTLPPELQLDETFTATAKIDGADVAGFIAAPNGAPLGPLVWGKNNGDSSLDLPNGSELLLVYRTEVRSVFGNPINNSATLDWTSLNEDVAGAPEFERHGNGCPSITAPDDYCVGPVQASIITEDKTAMNKTVIEDTDTDTDIGTLRLGDFVTYRLELSLQAGTTPAVSVQDTLPAGLVFDRVISINGDTDAPYIAGNGFSYSDIPLSAVPAQGAEGTINWNIGDVDRDFSSSLPLVVEYRVKVAEDNGIGHLPSQPLTNTAQIIYGSETQQSSAVISLLQPLLDSLEKTERSGKPNPYNNIDLQNDLMQFRLHACNSGGAPAYNLQFTDTLAMEMDETSIANVQVSIDGTALADTDYRYTPPADRGGDMLFVLSAPLPPGLCIDIDYDIGFHQDVSGDQSWVNTFTVDHYWSLPDSAAQQYSPVMLPVPFAMSTAAAVVEPLTKLLLLPADGTAAIGEQLHYRMTVPGVANDTVALRNVQVIDTLDSLGDIVIFESATLNGADFTPVVDQAAGTLTFDIPSIDVGAVAVIDILARVADVSGAIAGTNINNTADFTYWEGGNTLPGGGNAVSFTIVEPDLVMDKTGPANVQAGLPVRFILDLHNVGQGDAHNLTFTDVLPSVGDGGEVAGMCAAPPDNYTAEILDAGGNVIVTLSEGSDFTASFDGDSCTLLISGANTGLPADHHFQFAYDAYLDTDSTHGAALTNIAGATQWYGLPDDALLRRSYDRTLSDGTPGVLDAEDAFTIIAQVPRVSFYKTVENITRNDSPAVNASPADLLRYTLTLTNEEDVSVDGFSVQDDLGRLNPAVVFETDTLNIISLPAGADSSGSDLSGGTNAAGLLDIQNLSLAAAGEVGDSLEIVFEVQLAAVIDNSTAVLNQAQMQLPGQSIFVSDDPNINGAADPNVTGDEDPTQVTIESAPVFKVEKTSLDLTGEPDSLVPGDTLRYTLRVENIGNENMLEASLRDQVPANTTYVPGSTTLNGATLNDLDGSTPLAQTLVIQSPGAEAGQLLADPTAGGLQAALITFDVTINNVYDGTVISNQGFANGVGNGDGAGAPNKPLDEKPSDDPATEAPDDPTIDIVGNVPLLRAHKTVELAVDNLTAGIVDPEDVLRYTIAISNMGGKEATEVRFVDLVPEYTSYVTGSTTLNGMAVADDGSESPLIAGIAVSSEDLTPPRPNPGEGIISIGETATITFDVMVNVDTERGTVISNQGNLYSLELPLTLTDADGISSNGAQPTEIVVGDAQQLSITKEVAVIGGGAAESGKVLEYLIRVANISSVPVSLVSIYDDLLVAGDGVLTYVQDSALLNGQPDGVMVDGTLITVDYSSNYGDLPPGETITLRFEAKLGDNLAIGYSVINTAEVKWNDPPAYNQATVAIDIGGTPGIANLSGYLWHDVNFDTVADSTERVLSNWNIALYFNNALLETSQSDDNGYFQFYGLVPNRDGTDMPDADTQGASYELRYFAPNAVSSTASLGTASSDYTNGPQQVRNIYVGSGANPQNLNLPITPNGVVYDSVLRQPLAGVQVRMLGASSGQLLPDHCFDDPKQQNQVTLSGGFYKFDVNFSSAACAVNADYLIEVDVPSDDFVSGPSQIIPPQTHVDTGSFDVSACLGSAADLIPATPDHCEIQRITVPPSIDLDARSSETDYYLRLNLDDSNQPGSSQLFNNHIALDPQLEGALALTKTAAMLNVTRSQLVPYTITFSNTLPVPLTDLQLVDYFPAGFKYVAGSANLDGEPLEPEVNGLQLQWPHLRSEAEQTHTMKLLLVVGSGVGEGEYINRARMFNELSGQQASGEAMATVRVVPDPTFDCTDVIGKVYNDKNLNGYQDQDEGGVPGARVVTANGLRATTDAHGRFHITCAVVPNPDRGSNFVLKLDDRSLPSGYRLTTENPRVQRATRGKMLAFNFGTSLHRIVRLDLADAVFEPRSSELRPQWQSRTTLLLEKLQQAPSLLRLSYLAENEDPALVEARLKVIRARIAEDWAALDCCYPLNIESEIFWRRGAPPSHGGLLDDLKRSVDRALGNRRDAGGSQ